MWPTEQQLNWKYDMIRKSCREKKIGMVKGKIDTRGKLTMSPFSTRPLDVDGSGGTLFPLLTEVGQPARSTE